jgi:[glutamine synthetase] adenylyltransferase / [glutamine synthetase]-adenylyl-L-tyrosine phosphorylase
MTGIPLPQTMRGRICAAPLLPARVDALKLCHIKLIDLLDDRAAAAELSRIVETDEAARALIAGVVAHSPFLTRIIRQHPDWLIQSLSDDPDAYLTGILAPLVIDLARADSLPAAMAGLRLTRLRVALHIALADLAGVWDVDRVVEALTQFADVAVDVALRLALREAERSGRVQDEHLYTHPARSGIIILAMGKHGAHELNYSSDIDLIVLFRPDLVAVTDGREPLDVVVRIIKDMVKILHEQTGGGYVFRTDLRLRPDPASTPIAVPVDRAISYYQTVGQNWERAALIKARPMAGDLALGKAFLKELTPFIWRRYFDYASIADIHAMKRQIHAHKGGEVIAIEGHDVKLGRGGIREIEFFVQTQQLVFGGRKPVLRGQQTLAMLELLRDAGWIGDDAVSDLQAAYRFLRIVEHRLQMVEDQQTQRLPSSKAGVDGIALFCGLTPQAFRKVLTQHFRAVERHYARLFEDAPTLSATKGSLVFTGSTDDPETLKTLKRMGFQRPEVAAETVRGWHFGRRPAIVTPRAREVLTELVPALLEAFGKSSDPDGALVALDNALQGMPAVVELFTILRQNAALRGLFSEILGNAPRLAEVVVQRPHVLDALIDPELSEPASEQVLLKRFHARLDGIGSMEDFLDQTRDLARAERFMVGARLLSGIVDPLDAGRANSGVAAATIDVCLKRCRVELAQRHGIVPGARMAIVALGKLGGREMTALSDLDLMIVYGLQEGSDQSDGERPLYASEWFSRLTQRLVTALTVATKRGTLYDVDLRLRPSGSKGPVAVTLDAFRDYHVRESETWERMALTRARVVAGDRDFADGVKAAVISTYARKVEPKRLAKDILAMRELVAKEKPGKSQWDLKLASGGLVDIEFATQFLLLRHGSAAPDAIDANTGSALRKLADHGFLDPARAQILLDAWRLQSRLAQFIAIGPGADFDPAAVRKPFRQRLAAAAELPDFAVLERSLHELQRAAHDVMRDVIRV